MISQSSSVTTGALKNPPDNAKLTDTWTVLVKLASCVGSSSSSRMATRKFRKIGVDMGEKRGGGGGACTLIIHSQTASSYTRQRFTMVCILADTPAHSSAGKSARIKSSKIKSHSSAGRVIRRRRAQQSTVTITRVAPGPIWCRVAIRHGTAAACD